MEELFDKAMSAVNEFDADSHESRIIESALIFALGCTEDNPEADAEDFWAFVESSLSESREYVNRIIAHIYQAVK